MELFALAIRDLAIDAFSPPFFVPKIELAKRDLGNVVNRDSDNNNFHLHPEQFELYQLGTWNDQSGAFNQFERPRQVCVLSDLVKARS